MSTKIWLRPLPRAAFLLLFAAAFATILLVLGIELVIAAGPPAEVSTPPPVGAPLTHRLAFVVVDGLRYSIGTDATRMPNFARHMREDASGEIWASPVSMTSSAVLTYATGQRGDIDQIVNNETGRAVAYDHLLKNARSAGLFTAYTGDRAWLKMFPEGWDLSHPDPYGVGIEVDYNDQIFAAAYGFLKHEPRPNFYVFHFVTPDHQAHAYGTTSERYLAHIRAFDGLLEDLLRAIPADTTVIVTSDHGSTDTGTHGSDTPIQRQSPIFAYGPGIAKGHKETRRLEQIDIPATLAALLGIAAPAQSRGHVLVDWLDVDEEQRANIACADLARLTAYAKASGLDDAAVARAEGACAQGTASVRVEAARDAAAAIDRAITEDGPQGSKYGFLAPLFAVVGGFFIAFLALGSPLHGVRPRLTRGGAFALIVIAVAVLLTYGVELLPGDLPNAVRIGLYVVLNALLLYGILRPQKATAWLDRAASIGAVLLPGVVIVAPTRTTQAEGFAIAAVVALFAITVGLPRSDGGAPATSEPRKLLPKGRMLLTIVLLAALAPLAYREAEFLPKDLLKDTDALLVAALASIVIFAVERHLIDAKARWTTTCLGLIAACASLYFRRVAPAPLCFAVWIGAALAAYGAYGRVPRSLVELTALTSYAWVSRDQEIPILLASYVLASAVGDAVGRDLARDGEHSDLRPSAVLLLVSFLFGWTFVQRIGVQGGIDFIHLDWGAAAFREGDISMVRVGAGIAFKHMLARGAVFFALLVALPQRYREWVTRGVLVAETAHIATLVLFLYFGRSSFWTSMRAIGDAPHALMAVLTASIALVLVVKTTAEKGRNVA